MEMDVPSSDLLVDSELPSYIAATPVIVDDEDTPIATGETVYYTTAGMDVVGNPFVHFSLPVDATGLASGHYKFNIHLQMLDDEGEPLQVDDVDAVKDYGTDGGFGDEEEPEAVGINIINRVETTVGNRWTIDDLDSLVVQDSGLMGVMLVSNNGAGHWFQQVDDDFESPYDMLNMVMTFDDGHYFLTGPDTSFEEFDSDGHLVVQQDHLGNQTTFDYYEDNDTGHLLRAGIRHGPTVANANIHLCGRKAHGLHGLCRPHDDVGL